SFSRQVQGAVDEGGALGRGVRQEDANLAVLGGSRRAALLAGHAAGLLPLLRPAGLIHVEDPGCRVAQGLNDAVPEIIANAGGVPDGGAQQALHCPGPTLSSIASDRSVMTPSCQPFLRSTCSSKPARERPARSRASARAKRWPIRAWSSVQA